MARPHRRALAFLDFGFGDSSVNATELAPRQPASLQYALASLQGPSARQRVAAGPMLKIGARLCLSGCQQETCVPMQA